MAYFVRQWEFRVQSEDPCWFGKASCDLFKYLLLKVTYVVNNKRAVKSAGYSFQSAPRLCKGLVWSEGGKDQETPLLQPKIGEQWWPVIMGGDMFTSRVLLRGTQMFCVLVQSYYSTVVVH